MNATPGYSIEYMDEADRWAGKDAGRITYQRREDAIIVATGDFKSDRSKGILKNYRVVNERGGVVWSSAEIDKEEAEAVA